MSTIAVEGDRMRRVVKFLASGLPSFLIAVPANYLLVDRVGLAKSLAYALVIGGQVTLNFFVVRAFVFEGGGGSMVREFGEFVTGILAFRAVDWLVYVWLVEYCGFFYVAVQLLNVAVFSAAKFLFAERVFRAERQPEVRPP